MSYIITAIVAFLVGAFAAAQYMGRKGSSE